LQRRNQLKKNLKEGGASQEKEESQRLASWKGKHRKGGACFPLQRRGTRQNNKGGEKRNNQLKKRKKWQFFYYKKRLSKEKKQR